MTEDDFNKRVATAILANATDTDSLRLIAEDAVLVARLAEIRDALDGEVTALLTAALPFDSDSASEGVQRLLAVRRLARLLAQATATASLTPEDADDDLANLRDEIKDALEGDSNDAEHDALVSVADYFNITYTPSDC